MRSFRNADGRRPTSVRTAALCFLVLASVVGAGATFGREPAHLADRGSNPTAAETSNAVARRRFQDDRFGLALQWGVFALIGKGAWVMERDKLPVDEYEKLPPRFNPAEFDAESWVKAAKSAGANYLVVTAKHHDGFCLFDSALTRYDVVDATPYGRDPLKDVAEACRRHRMALFFDYSLLDWHHPDYAPLGRTGRHAGRESGGDWAKYVAYYQGQVRELCTNYGPIGGIRFSGLWDKPDADWDLADTYRMVHELQPGALVANDHHFPPPSGEDVLVFEREPPDFDEAAAPREVVRTLNRSTGYDARDTEFKGAGELIRLLADAAGRNANLLLGVGPKDDGSLPAVVLDRLEDVGRRLEGRSASICGTRAGPIPPQPWGVSTEKARENRPTTVFLHVLTPEAPVVLPAVTLSFDAKVLGRTDPIPLRREGRHVVLRVPEADRSSDDTVIELTPRVLGAGREGR